MGFDFFGKTVGIIDTGKIGTVFADICKGFGMKIIYYDVIKNPAIDKIGGELVSLETLFAESKLISLHCPLNNKTKYIINKESLDLLKMNPFIIKTGRGALIETCHIIQALNNKQIYGLGIDVYENEADLFFEDHSLDVMTDDILSRIVSLPNVIVTGHQAFFPDEAMNNISHTTLSNINQIKFTGKCENEINI